MGATINDVAQLAGVSAATVSRVLNNSPSVRLETREKVNRAIEELNYSPNMLGNFLRKSKTNQILILVPTVNNPIYSSFIEGVQSESETLGYRTLIGNTHEREDMFQFYSNLLAQRLVDGLILREMVNIPDSLISLAKRFPVVQCSHYNPKWETSFVGIDHASATRVAMSHIISLGRKKIAMLNSDKRLYYASVREKVFEESIEKSGLTVQRDWIKYVYEINFELALVAARELLSDKNDLPDAIFCISDVYAAACIKTIQQEGLRVPQDIAVVGFDNINIASMTTPAITTINQPLFRMGSEAFRLLNERIENPNFTPKQIILPADLIVRGSTMDVAT